MHPPVTPPALRIVYAIGIVVAVCFAVVHLGWLVAGASIDRLPATLVGTLAGMLVADWFTGVVHWACDTWGDDGTPIFGPGLIRNFREHHRRPQAMLEHDWVDVNGEAASAAAVLFLLFSTFGAAWLAASPAAHAALLAFLVFGALANQIHQWAHMREAPRVVRALQRSGLLLSRERHVGHHRAPHLTGYAISTGWTNRTLDAIGYWRGLEVAIAKLTGAVPRRAERRAG